MEFWDVLQNWKIRISGKIGEILQRQVAARETGSYRLLAALQTASVVCGTEQSCLRRVTCAMAIFHE
jgi:hypothetical protein